LEFGIQVPSSRMTRVLLTQAGNYVRDDVVACVIQLVSDSADHHGYMTAALWTALASQPLASQPLAQVATWAVGEFGDLLVADDPPKVTNVALVGLSCGCRPVLVECDVAKERCFVRFD
jgi:hypothetical protein